eukprot:468502-Prymnesium_polylepis.1
MADLSWPLPRVPSAPPPQENSPGVPQMAPPSPIWQENSPGVPQMATPSPIWQENSPGVARAFQRQSVATTMVGVNVAAEQSVGRPSAKVGSPVASRRALKPATHSRYGLEKSGVLMQERTHEQELEIQRWASDRSQVLSRTVRG